MHHSRWRLRLAYGWVPPGDSISITEQEFDHARKRGKTCLCYVASERHPWPPALMDHGGERDALERFRKKVAKLVRSEFTTPDNLAKQVAANVARELAPRKDRDSVGGLLQMNWDLIHPELQAVHRCLQAGKGGQPRWSSGNSPRPSRAGIGT